MNEPQEFLTCTCGHCGQTLEFPAEIVFHQSACPTCGYQVVLKGANSVPPVIPRAGGLQVGGVKYLFFAIAAGFIAAGIINHNDLSASAATERQMEQAERAQKFEDQDHRQTPMFIGGAAVFFLAGTIMCLKK
jgi:DNA-directed RNA polymerase subunit RPC12/RpoP